LSDRLLLILFEIIFLYFYAPIHRIIRTSQRSTLIHILLEMVELDTRIRSPTPQVSEEVTEPELPAEYEDYNDDKAQWHEDELDAQSQHKGGGGGGRRWKGGTFQVYSSRHVRRVVGNLARPKPIGKHQRKLNKKGSKKTWAQ